MVGWDDVLPKDVVKLWKIWVESLNQLLVVLVNRCVEPFGFGNVKHSAFGYGTLDLHQIRAEQSPLVCVIHHHSSCLKLQWAVAWRVGLKNPPRSRQSWGPLLAKEIETAEVLILRQGNSFPNEIQSLKREMILISSCLHPPVPKFDDDLKCFEGHLGATDLTIGSMYHPLWVYLMATLIVLDCMEWTLINPRLECS